MTTSLKRARAGLSNGLLPLLLSAVLLTACSQNPNQAKLDYLKSGEKYFSAGKYQEAVIQFRNAVQADPRFADAHWNLARAYLKLGNSEAAYRELTETVTLDPKNADAQLQLSMLLLSRRAYDSAQAAAQRVLQLQPNNPQAHAILGEKYVLTHDWPNAIRELQKSVDGDPQRVEAHGALGAAYLAAGQPAAAEAAYRKAVALNPKSVQAHVALGEFWFSQRKIAEAENEMRVAAGLDEHAIPPRLLLARLLILTGRLADAEKLYTNLKTIAPEDPQAYRALGLFYNSIGQKEKAATEFQSLLVSRPRDVAVKANLVDTLIDLNRIQEAAALDQEILRELPAEPRALLSEGRVLIAEAKWQQAVVVLEKVIQSEPKTANAYYYLGIAQKSLGLLELARSSFTTALQLAPGSAEASAALAVLDLKRGDAGEALRLASAALQANPGSHAAQVAQARALLAKGDARRAEAVIEDVLKKEPVSLPALAVLLNLDIRTGKTGQAIERFSGLIQPHPQNAGLHFLLALAYFNINDLHSAQTSAQHAILLDPKTPQAYTLLANIDLAAGSAEAAKQDFLYAIQADPRNLKNYLALEDVYEKQGNWDESKKLAEQAHRIDPTSPVAAGSLALLYLDHGGDVNVAVSLAQMAKEKMPNSPIAADTLGWAYYRLGSPDSAIAQLKESVQAAPNNPRYQYHLGMAYIAARRLELARQSLQQALKDDPKSSYAAASRTALKELPASAH